MQFFILFFIRIQYPGSGYFVLISQDAILTMNGSIIDINKQMKKVIFGTCILIVVLNRSKNRENS